MPCTRSHACELCTPLKNVYIYHLKAILAKVQILWCVRRSSSSTRDGTHAPCIGSVASSLLDHLRRPSPLHTWTTSSPRTTTHYEWWTAWHYTLSCLRAPGCWGWSLSQDQAEWTHLAVERKPASGILTKLTRTGFSNENKRAQDNQPSPEALDSVGPPEDSRSLLFPSPTLTGREVQPNPKWP